MVKKNIIREKMRSVRWRIQRCFKGKNGDDSFGLLKAGETAQIAHMVAWLSQREKTKAQKRLTSPYLTNYREGLHVVTSPFCA